jgi:transcriptional regulator
VLLLTSDKSRRILLSDVDNTHRPDVRRLHRRLDRRETPRDDWTITVAKLDLLQGTLDLLILKTLALGPQHGWGIAQRIQQISGQVLKVNQGSLYPALQRLETAGWIDAEWGASENNRQARFYNLTRKGERQLKDETLQWERMTGAVAKILASEA